MAGSDRVVLKFGGSSVATASGWESVRRAIDEERAAGRRALVVCSALGGVSDELEELAGSAASGAVLDDRLDALRRRHLALGVDLGVDALPLLLPVLRRIRHLLPPGRPAPPEIRAEVLAQGEILSTAIGTLWLRRGGVRVENVDARRLLVAAPPLPGVCATDRYLAASCRYDPRPEVGAILDGLDAEVVVTQGFIARDASGATVLLGRGGSDTAAACLAAILGAARLDIWTDVPGVFTANPRLLPSARLVRSLDYDEAEVLAGLGVGVLHAPCIEPVRGRSVPVRIRWTGRPGVEGTSIGSRLERSEPGPWAVTSRGRVRALALDCRTSWAPVDLLAEVAGAFRRHAVPPDLLTSPSGRIRALVDLDAKPGVEDRLPALLEELGRMGDARTLDLGATVSLVGRGVQGAFPRWAPMLSVLGPHRVRLVSPSADDLSVTFLVERGAEFRIVRDLHAALLEGNEEVPGLGPDWRALSEGPGSGGRRDLVGAAGA